MGLDVEGCSRHGKPSVSQGRPSVIIAHGTDDGNLSARKPWRHPYPRRFRETVLANSIQGRRLNRPNDVVVKSDGAIYFTDPFRALGISPRSLEEKLEAMLKHGKTQTQKTPIPGRD